MNRAPQALTILLADDDPEDRDFIAKELLGSGFARRIETAGDGEELLAYLHREGRFADAATAPRPDLILLDLKMPRMDGLQALRAIKHDPALRCIPVVALTVSDYEQDVLDTYELGANAFVPKPATIDDLHRVVTALQRFWAQVATLPRSETIQAS